MSGTRLTRSDRTRRDIVDSAIEVWAEDNTASLGAVAEGAGVGRTTLNRYFTDRARLISAVDEECRSRYVTAMNHSRIEEGSGRDAVLRICTELLHLGPVLGLVFSDNALVSPDGWFTEEEDPLGIAIGRGYADGSLDSTLPGDWVGTFVWTSLFAAQIGVGSGVRTAHEAAMLLTRTLSHGVTKEH